MPQYFARWKSGYAENRDTINSARLDAILYLKTHWDDRVGIMKETKNNISGVGDVYFRNNGFRYYDRKKQAYYILHPWDGSIGPMIEKIPAPFGL